MKEMRDEIEGALGKNQGSIDFGSAHYCNGLHPCADVAGLAQKMDMPSLEEE